MSVRPKEGTRIYLDGVLIDCRGFSASSEPVSVRIDGAVTSRPYVRFDAEGLPTTGKHRVLVVLADGSAIESDATAEVCWNSWSECDELRYWIDGARHIPASYP
jgi:hypothetical protein